MFGAGLGHLVPGLDKLAGVGVGQDEASGQAHAEHHDKQNIEISVVALGTSVRHDLHVPVGSKDSAQATGVARCCSSSSRRFRRVLSLGLSLQFMAVWE